MNAMDVLLIGVVLFGLLMILFPPQAQAHQHKISDLTEEELISALNKSGVLVREGHVDHILSNYANVDKESFIYVAKQNGLVIKERGGVFITSWQGMTYIYTVRE